MLKVYRWPDDKPKKPKAPVETAHFAKNWQERTGLSLSTFRKRWKSASFLGATEQSRWGHKPIDWGRTGRVQYYAVGPWVVFVTMPRSGRCRFLSVWPHAWFDGYWADAMAHMPQDSCEEEETGEEGAPNSDCATADADLACASVEA